MELDIEKTAKTIFKARYPIYEWKDLEKNNGYAIKEEFMAMARAVNEKLPELLRNWNRRA